MSLIDAGGGDGGDSGTAGDGGTGDSGNDGGNNMDHAPEWVKSIEGVDPELVSDPSLKAINNPAELLKSYVNAQKLIGKDKVVLPTEKSSETEWTQFWQKLGRPEKADDYQFDLGEKKSFDDNFVGKFRELAHKHNILPNQAQALMKELNEYETSQDANFQQDLEAKVNEARESLQTEWGDAYQSNVKKAAEAVKEFGGEEMFEYVKQAGYGSDPKFLQFMVKIANSTLGEDKIGDTGAGNQSGISPDEAQRRINEAYGDKAYTDPHHPDHKRKVDEVQKLFKIMHQYETKKQSVGF